VQRLKKFHDTPHAVLKSNGPPERFESSDQRILSPGEPLRYYRTTGLTLTQMQELVRRVNGALDEP
jgi:hypothetical protein